MSSISLPTPPTAATPTVPAANSQAQLTSENTFLKLLVAQIQNQDPTSPTDPTQFVAQLTQYSELEQLMQINSGIQTIGGSKSAAPATGGPQSPVTSPTPLTPPGTLHTTEEVSRTSTAIKS